MNKNTPEQLDQVFSRVKELVINPDLKLRIIDLRKFIDEIYPRETDTSKQDFADIRQRFVGLNKRVEQIERCLGIDFKLDELKPVNYDFIKDDLMRDKANAYYREMLRYQFGTRNHKICFGEFCRLATIQIEVILNYFYTNDNHKDIIDKIAKNKFDTAYKEWDNNKEGKNDTEEPKLQDFKDYVCENKEELVPAFPLATKCSSFLNNYLKNYYINNFTVISISIWTAELRNRKSHGSKSTIEPYERDLLTDDEKQRLEECRKELVKLIEKYNNEHEEHIKFINNRLKPGPVGWPNVPKDIKDLYNKKFSPLQFMSERSFKDVHDFLRIIASTCAKKL